MDKAAIEILILGKPITTPGQESRRVRLTKVSKNENDLRTDVITGECARMPQPGFSFNMTAKPLESGNVRLITTSSVDTITKVDDKKYIFTTLNSTYELDVL